MLSAQTPTARPTLRTAAAVTVVRRRWHDAVIEYARHHQLIEALSSALDDYEAGAIDLSQLAEDFNGLVNPPPARPPVGQTPGLGIQQRAERVEPNAGRVVSWVVYSGNGGLPAEPERGRVATFFTRTFRRR